MKQMAQMAGVTRFICYFMLILSLINFYTRYTSY